jgi:hypothetical protein
MAKKKVSRKASLKTKPKLLAGGNPQIAKGSGDKPVRDYIAAMPGWKKNVGRKLDALISEAIPDVQKAIKWNTPFYGIDADGWFVAFHCLTKYIKVAFPQGTSLKPIPPEKSKQANVRYFHIFEGDEINEELFKSWVQQASRLPAEKL